MQETEFEIDRNAVEKYRRAYVVLLFLFATLGLFSGGLTMEPATFRSHGDYIVTCLLFFFVFFPFIFCVFLFGLWLVRRQANSLRYRLEGSTLRADGGVFFLFRKSIPLERITDIALVQGPLLRYFNIWAMQIQTAGSAQCEATLYGVRNPEEMRELILSRRKQVYGEKTEDA